jgi:ABC-type nitrate/sulfonate/bicarbonate transport system ATPase subunit
MTATRTTESEAPSITGGVKLRLDKVCKTYRTPAGGALDILTETTFDIRNREIVTIVGPSGCGKSTLLNILAALTEPNGGRMLIDGAEQPDRGRYFGYMFQKDLLFPWRTIIDNVALGLEIRGTPRKEARTLSADMLKRFHLDKFASHFPSQLSGGMRQRVALMRTLLCNRPILLLDEPFAALDALTRSVMQEWLLQIWEQDHRTILFITHDVEEAIILSDRVLVMSARPGRIKFEIAIDLPRPRDHSLRTTSRFTELKGLVLDQIYEETIKSMEGNAGSAPASNKRDEE